MILGASWDFYFRIGAKNASLLRRGRSKRLSSGQSRLAMMRMLRKRTLAARRIAANTNGPFANKP
jgi:hypothetical protein